MRTIQKDVYTIRELQEDYPEVFDKVIEKLQRYQIDDCFTATEVVNSLKKCIEATNYTLYDYSIGAYSQNTCIKLNTAPTDDLVGKRAVAWLENILLSQFRIPFKLNKEYLKYNQAYENKQLRPYSPGKVKPCPFTGVCFDENFIIALTNNIKSGMTVRDSLLNLADVAKHLIEEEIEYHTSIDYLIEESEANNREFYADGEEI